MTARRRWLGLRHETAKAAAAEDFGRGKDVLSAAERELFPKAGDHP